MANEQDQTEVQAPEPVETPEPVESAEPVEAAAPTPAAPRRAVQGGGKLVGLGRRKTSVARVYLQPGEGRWVVNGRTLEDYFPRPTLRQAIAQPFAATDTVNRFDVRVKVNGGGLRGQADAIRLGISRALLKVDEENRPRLRAQALLTRDPREVERKKPGRPKARKRFQFSKR